MSETQSWLVVGLGNPGPQYHNTRHNIGRMALAELANRQIPTATLSTHKRSNADIAEVRFTTRAEASNIHMILAQPRTYMNLSGGPVAALTSFFNIPPERVIVIHDELELNPWAVNARLGGGDKGHNGLKDISKALGTKEYWRIRCGIGRPPGRMDPAAYVLKRFPNSEEADVAIMCADAADAIERIISETP